MGYLRLLRRRRVLLLWTAQTLSVLGDRMYALAVMWLVWEATGSAALMGAVVVAESLPYVVVGSIGQPLVSRFATLRRLALLDLARMGAVAMLPLLWLTSGPSVTALLVVAAVLGVLSAVFDPNLAAMVPEFVAPDEVQQVTGLMDLMGRIARVAGPGAAAVLLMLIAEVHLYTIDALTFGASAAALGVLARVTVPRRKVSNDPMEPEPRPSLIGARRLVRDQPLAGCMIGLHAAGQMLAGVGLVLPALLALRLDAGAEVFAAAAFASGIGAVAANALAGNLRFASVFPAAYCVAWIAEGAALVGIGLSTTVWQVLALSAVSGAISPFIAVGLRTHLSRFPRRERLSLMTLDQTVLRAAGLVGAAVIPLLASGEPALAYVLGGVATALVACAAWAAASVVAPRSREREPQAVR